MFVLETLLQQKVAEQIEKANQYRDINQEKYFEVLEAAWALYPIPKENYADAYHLAKEIFSRHLQNREINQAERWLHEMIRNSNTLQHHECDCQFNEAKFLYESGDQEQALILFRKLVRRFGMAYLETEGTQYKEFYLKYK